MKVEARSRVPKVSRGDRGRPREGTVACARKRKDGKGRGREVC